MISAVVTVAFDAIGLDREVKLNFDFGVLKSSVSSPGDFVANFPHLYIFF